jgi:4-hydroxybutyrate CoA-transferase
VAGNSRIVSADTAVKAVESGMSVRIPTGHNPHLLGDALAARIDELRDVKVVHCAGAQDYPWLGPGFEGAFAVTHEHWAGPNSWAAMKERRHDYLPLPFSLRFKAARDGRPAAESRIMDVVCVQTSPPTSAGTVNLGPFPWDAPEYMRRAKIVLAEIVPNLVEVVGDSDVPADLITYFVESEPVPYVTMPNPISPDPRAEARARHVAGLISDGDCLQIGAGSATFSMIPALVRLLGDRNDLGWHSEAGPPGLLELLRLGVINSARVPAHPGVSVAGGWSVLEADRSFIERNEHVQGHEIWKVVDPRVVAAIPNYRAINTAILVDLTGQAAAESVGTAMHSGTGGLLELTIGALWSPGGRSILVLSATDQTAGRSRIVATLPEGTQVTVPRTLVDTVVTEYGVATLLGRTARERAAALIDIAAPEHREELTWASRQLFYP